MPKQESNVQDKTEQKTNKSFHKGKFPKESRSKGKGDPRECDYGSNDVRWYGTPDVVRLAGNLSFFKSLGLPLQPFSTMYSAGSRVPGICRIDIMDALPVSDPTSVAINAINVAAKQQYALIRKANSGAKNYEWSDLIVYELARSSLNQVFAFIARAYGVAKTYNMMNRYQPLAILTAMGFNATDFISNLANIRLWLNNFARRLNTLALPHSLSYFERKAWLYSGIYTDGSSAKSQIYFLNPGQFEGDVGAFLVYDATLSANGGCLRRESVFQVGGNFADWSPVADSWLDILLTDDDAAIISGDILKAYGDSNLFKCLEIPEDYTVTPVYNQEVLSQIENLTTCPKNYEPQAYSTDTGDTAYIHRGFILQNSDHNLVFNPIFNLSTSNSIAADNYIIKPVINFHHTDVTPDEVMVGTRLTTCFNVVGQDSGTNDYYSGVVTCGTEIVTALVVYRNPTGINAIDINSVIYGTISNQEFYKILALVNFDWAPKLYVFDTATGYGGNIPLGDLDTYRLMEVEELKKLHDTAGLYLLGVPLIDSYNKA